MEPVVDEAGLIADDGLSGCEELAPGVGSLAGAGELAGDPEGLGAVAPGGVVPGEGVPLLCGWLESLVPGAVSLAGAGELAGDPEGPGVVAPGGVVPGEGVRLLCGRLESLEPVEAGVDFLGSARRMLTELPAPTSTIRRFSSVNSCDRTMCGMMANTISFSCLCLSSCANRYFNIGSFASPG